MGKVEERPSGYGRRSFGVSPNGTMFVWGPRGDVVETTRGYRSVFPISRGTSYIYVSCLLATRPGCPCQVPASRRLHFSLSLRTMVGSILAIQPTSALRSNTPRIRLDDLLATSTARGGAFSSVQVEEDLRRVPPSTHPLHDVALGRLIYIRVLRFDLTRHLDIPPF
ncbi:hypothetical protein C8Q73DRAFT_449221 [Cubamyces lactineus]|nr:hypothetical protein C8Q73DRAFT_449221 [Cubamyces lactineus]